MTIDPRYGLWLSIALVIIGTIAGGATQLADIFDPLTAKKILAVAVMLLTAGNGLNALLHAIPSKPGAANEFPLGPKAPEPPKV